MSSEKQQIEAYLKQFCIEECLDEAVNSVIKDRPKNPYKAISMSVEAKTLPEIVDVTLMMTLVGLNTWGVTATVHTNISSFTGTACYSTDEYSFPVIKDFTNINEKVKVALVGTDPVQLQEVDAVLQSIEDLAPSESLALSMACCRAGARHKGIAPYQFIAECYGGGSTSSDMAIPLPVVTLLSKMSPECEYYQDVLVMPVGAQTYEIALQQALETSRCVATAETVQPIHFRSTSGCRCFDSADVKPVLKELVDCFVNAGISDVKMGFNMRAGKHVKASTAGEGSSTTPTYTFDGPDGPSLSSGDVIDSVCDLWADAHVASFDAPLAIVDVGALGALKKKLHETFQELKGHGKQHKSHYFVAGVGGDSHCHLQVVVDSNDFETITLPTDEFSATYPYNCVKVQLGTFSSVSQALDMCRRARAYNCTVMVSSCHDASQPDSEDTLVADFAVAIGAGQFLAGGLSEGHNVAKYNRVLAIQQEKESLPYVGAKFRKILH